MVCNQAASWKRPYKKTRAMGHGQKNVMFGLFVVSILGFSHVQLKLVGFFSPQGVFLWAKSCDKMKQKGWTSTVLNKKKRKQFAQTRNQEFRFRHSGHSRRLKYLTDPGLRLQLLPDAKLKRCDSLLGCRGLLGGGFIFFHPDSWGNDPIWLIFFKWVETTNQSMLFSTGNFFVR